LGRRGWRDTRLLVGVLLVLVSVVIGARLFATADRTQEWLVARTDLPAGHVVAAADLTTTSAHLDSATARRYYPGRRAPELVGGTLARPISAGELVSGADFAGAAASASRLVPVVVKAGRLTDLTAGDHVDVYVYQPSGAVVGDGTAGAGTGTGTGTAQPSTGQPAAGGAGAEVLVLHDVEFVSQTRIASGDRSLTLRVPVDAAIRAIAASQSDRVDVVRLERDARGSVGPSGPTAAPGYGR
jgi:hypothetical protein